MRHDYPEEAGLDEAVRAAVKHSHPDGIVVNWVVLAATRSSGLDGVSHAFFTPDGQPNYATVGLLIMTSDWMRGLTHDDEDEDSV